MWLFQLRGITPFPPSLPDLQFTSKIQLRQFALQEYQEQERFRNVPFCRNRILCSFGTFLFLKKWRVSLLNKCLFRFGMDYLDRLPPSLLFIFQLFFFFFSFLQDDNSRISNLKDYYGLFSLVVIIIFEYDCLPKTSKAMLFF